MVRFKKFFASMSACAVLVAGIATPPAMAQPVNQDGLVNVAIGDITIEDVAVGVAAQVVANVCGVQVGPVVLIAQRVDATSTQRTVCTAEGAPVTIRQNN